MIYGLFRFELKKNLKDKGLLFWMLILPILFIVLFGYIFSNQTTDVTFDIPYMDEDQSGMSEQFISALGSNNTFELQAQENPNEAMEQLENGDINAFVHIPSGFGDQMMSGEENPIFFHYNPVNEESVAPVRSLLENVSYSFQEDGVRSALNDAGLDANEILDSGIEIVAEEQVASSEFDTITHIIPGYTVMFTFFIMISMVMSFVKDMQNGMVARLASTPLTKYQYLLGKWFPYILIVLAQIVALLLFGYFVYGVELGNIAALFLISLALAVITTGWGLALSLITKNENMGLAITQIIALGGAMIGGLWVPTEFLPEFMQTMGLFLPQYWAQQGFLEVMMYGGGIMDIFMHVGILLGYALLGLAIAILGYRRFLAAARG